MPAFCRSDCFQGHSSPSLGLCALLLLVAAPYAFSFEEQDSKTGAVREVSPQPGIVAPASNASELPQPIYLDDTGTSQPNGYAHDDLYMEKQSGGLPSSKKKLTGGINLGLSMFSFDAKIFVGIPMYKFLRTEGGLSYWSSEDDDAKLRGYGPAVDLIAFIPNLKVFQPFAGIGVGYESWIQKSKNEIIEEASSWTSGYFFGGAISLTKNFGLKLARRTKNYTSRPPRRLSSEERSPDPVYTTEIGFYAVL